MKVYSNIFDHIDIASIDHPSEMDTEAPVSMIFAHEDVDTDSMVKEASMSSSLQNFFGCYTVNDREIWRIDGSNIIRVANEISEG